MMLLAAMASLFFIPADKDKHNRDALELLAKKRAQASDGVHTTAV